MRLLKGSIVAAGLAGSVLAQYFPPSPEGVTTIRSNVTKGVSISYKEVRRLFVCQPMGELTESPLSQGFVKPLKGSNPMLAT